MINKRCVLNRPLAAGVPVADDFRVEPEEVAQPQPGEVLVRHRYLSLDPYQRAAIGGRHGGPGGPLGEGDMPGGETVGQVIESNQTSIPSGAWVRHAGGWQEFSVAAVDDVECLPESTLPPSVWLGALGMPGLTAWASVARLAEVQPGQTVLVSAAAGPVGATAGQLAREMGGRAVGIAGSDEKCAYLTGELGFEAAVNYKAPEFLSALAAVLPDGADVYHDNVGGQMLMDALGVLRPYGTVILCGLMSSYNDPAQRKDLYIGLPILKRAVLKGLVVYDFEAQRSEFVAQLQPLVERGAIKILEDCASGIESAGQQFCRLMRGENFGKALVEL